MMRTKSSSLLSFFYLPFFSGLLLFGLFSLVWLRSGIVQTTYYVRSLEEKKMDSLKERKMLLAERAKMMAIGKVGAHPADDNQSEGKVAAAGYVFPDRTRVIHVTKNKASEPYKASLDTGAKKR